MQEDIPGVLRTSSTFFWPVDFFSDQLNIFLPVELFGPVELFWTS